jgi:hypothetical protein
MALHFHFEDRRLLARAAGAGPGGWTFVLAAAC